MLWLVFQYYVSLCFAQDSTFFWQSEIIGTSEQNRDIMVEQFGQGPHVFAVFASIHGTETIGTPLLLQFSDYLRAHPEITTGNTILLCYMINPDGSVQGIRGNKDNIDINRNFPVPNFGRGLFNGEEPLSAIETNIIVNFLQTYQPERTLIIHQPLHGIDFDGDAKGLATHISEVSGIRIQKLGSRSGSLGTYIAYTLHKEVITLEIPGAAKDKTPDWLWNRYGVVLQEFVRYPTE
jgi:hypothetical protein